MLDLKDITLTFDAKIVAAEVVDAELLKKVYMYLPQEYHVRQRVTQLHIEPYRGIHALLLDERYIGFAPGDTLKDVVVLNHSLVPSIGFGRVGYQVKERALQPREEPLAFLHRTLAYESPRYRSLRKELASGKEAF